MINSTFVHKAGIAATITGIAFTSLAFTSGISNASNTTTTEISIPVSTIVRKIGVGNSKVLTTKTVTPEYQGMICSVKATAENQGSVHPGNNLVIASGNESVTLSDVEREAVVLTEATGDLKLADEVTVSLVMGQDDVFSAGMDVVLTCAEDHEVEICRDGKLILVKESTVTETDTTTCPTPKEVKVCRDGEVIIVTEDSVLDSDRNGDCPETLGTTTELPNTGAGAFATAALSLTSVVTGVYGYAKSRR